MTENVMFCLYNNNSVSKQAGVSVNICHFRLSDPALGIKGLHSYGRVRPCQHTLGLSGSDTSLLQQLPVSANRYILQLLVSINKNG